MELTDEEIQEFAKIWKEEFKEELTPEQAKYEAQRFLELYLLLAGFPDH